MEQERISMGGRLNILSGILYFFTHSYTISLFYSVCKKILKQNKANPVYQIDL